MDAKHGAARQDADAEELDLEERRRLIAEAGARVTEVVRYRRANGIPPPAGRKRRSKPPPQLGTAAPELHDVAVHDLPRFQIGADE